jgi:hypothetical protein
MAPFVQPLRGGRGKGAPDSPKLSSGGFVPPKSLKSGLGSPEVLMIGFIAFLRVSVRVYWWG